MNMTNSRYESSDITDKRLNRASWVFAGAVGAATLAWAATHPTKSEKLPELTGTGPVVEATCSRGHARNYNETSTTVNGQRMRVDCYKYWSTQGQRMP
jgi:hypothetical protein